MVRFRHSCYLFRATSFHRLIDPNSESHIHRWMTLLGCKVLWELHAKLLYSGSIGSENSMYGFCLLLRHSEDVYLQEILQTGQKKTHLRKMSLDLVKLQLKLLISQLNVLEFILENKELVTSWLKLISTAGTVIVFLGFV